MSLFKKNPKVAPIAEAGQNHPNEKQELPDSTSPEGTCTRCGFKASFSVVASHALSHSHLGFGFTNQTFDSRYPVEQVTVLFCHHCKESLIVLEQQTVGGKTWHKSESGGALGWHGFFWWPLPSASVSNDVPVAIRDCFIEAGRALGAGCPRAAAVMARRTLEAICADQGANEGNLAKRLVDLSAAGKLLPTLADWAKEVRLVGNKGAHFDPIETVVASDVAQLLAFEEELLRFLYDLPAELKRRRSDAP